MIEIGQYSTLRVVKEVDFGIYLDGDEHGEILMPTRFVPENCKVDDELEVFLYLDSEDRIIATSEKPYAKAGEFAYLEVVSVSTIGAFLNWGLMKDLLLPFREQKRELTEGEKVFVYVYLDAESKRLVASAKIDKHIDNLPVYYKEGDEVDAVIWAETDLGYKVIMENHYSGILYKNEVFQKLEPGQKVTAFIKKVRTDEKLDLTLYKPGYEKVGGFTEQILSYLEQQGGSMSINDKSSAEEISKTFGISKKNFKKAVGSLYKDKKIAISDKGIQLIK